jgi:hypothetical protein
MSDLRISGSTLTPMHALKLSPVKEQVSVKQMGKAICQLLKKVAHLKAINGIQPVPQFYKELGSLRNDRAASAHEGGCVFIQFYGHMNMTDNKKRDAFSQKAEAL